jgi:hypothetical protein
MSSARFSTAASARCWSPTSDIVRSAASAFDTSCHERFAAGLDVDSLRAARHDLPRATAVGEVRERVREAVHLALQIGVELPHRVELAIHLALGEQRHLGTHRHARDSHRRARSPAARPSA